MNDQSGAEVWVRADPAAVWRYGKVMSAIGLVVMPAVVGVGVLAEAINGTTEVVWII